MDNFTSEQTERWTRLMAEAEGWHRARVCPDGAFWLVKRIPRTRGWRWLRNLFCRLAWYRYPDIAESLPHYPSDLNALRRVAVKICEARAGMALLDDALCEVNRLMIDQLNPRAEFYLAHQVCLPPEELFPIYGKVLEKLNGEKSEAPVDRLKQAIKEAELAADADEARWKIRR